MKTKLSTTAIILFYFSTLSFSQELNGPTSWDVYGNVFSQPNVHMQVGRNKLDWYGSGDVNNDEVINNKDLDAMNYGVKNDRSDVDGDGTPSTSNDKQILQEYLNGTRSYLPGHWDSLKTKEEQRSWKDKMFTIDDKTLLDYVKNSGQLWACRNFQKQREIDFYGISNIKEFIEKQENNGEVTYDSTHNARFNIPLQYFSTKTTSGDFHAVSGTLVGDNPLNFDDWYFVEYATDDRIYPGDFAMSGDGYAHMKKTAYVESSLTGKRYFTFSENILIFNLENNEANLEHYDTFRLLLHNPNIIKVEVENIPSVTLNYTSNLSVDPSVTGVPNIIVKNSPLEKVFEEPKPVPQQNDIDKVYVTRDFVDGEHYNVNSTYPNIEYSFDRTWNGHGYSGGVTKNGSLVQRINVKDLENPHGKKPDDVNITKEQMDNNGGLSPTITGNVTNVSDNSGLDVDVSVNYDFVSEDSDKQVYHGFYTLVDKFGNDTTFSPQKVTVLFAALSLETLSDITVNAERNQNLSPEALEQQGYNAIPKVTVSNTTSGHTLEYRDADTTYFSTKYAWADREFTRTYICRLTTGASSDTIKYKVRVKDLENPKVSDLEAITIAKDQLLIPAVTGYPEITDNVAVKDTVITYTVISESSTEKKYNAIAAVTDVFGNDTTYNYQEVTVDLTTGLEDTEKLPSKFELSQNYPNPFNPTTTISYSVPVSQTFLSANPHTNQSQNFSQTGKSVLRKNVPQTILSATTTQTTSQNVSLVVYNILGKKVATLVNETKPAGRYSVTFNAEHLPSGIYLYRFTSREFSETKQMLLLK